MKKSLILINNRKKIRLWRDTYPGDSLSGGQVSDGPLRGGLNGAENTRKNMSEIVKNTL